jgi:hypothetical protein
MLIQMLDELESCVYTGGFGDRLHVGIVSLMIQKENPQTSLDYAHTSIHVLDDLESDVGRRIRAICIPLDDRIAVSSTFDRR